MSDRPPSRLAIVVSHPIQYYAPLYQRLARRKDLAIKVFFTWHAGEGPVLDAGFRRQVEWDLPLLEGYEYERVPNVSSDPGTHSFFGLRNPELVERAMAWGPDAVHVTGWAWLSHLLAMRALSRRGVPVLFRGDSHLLDGPNRGIRWWLKRAVLRRVFSWPDAFLYVGSANRAYYEAFDVDAARLWACPHAIDVGRFAEPSASYETEAAEWRSRLGIAADKAVLLFAGKFERKKCPIELMNAVRYLDDPRVVLVLVGGGELEGEVNELASRDPARFKVLPFQNQSRMPVVYRLGGIFVLPSAFGETWGLAVNEALACGRPVIVSDRVGCAADVVNETCGRVFTAGDFSGMMRFVSELSGNRRKLAELGRSAAQGAWAFDLERTETALVNCLQGVLNK